MVFKVVSVEDEPEIAELLKIVLGNPEIDVHTADNGRDGLALIRSLKPDLLVLDIMMPGGVNGWDVYDAVRTTPDTEKIPIIMLSVLREKAERRQAFAGSEIDLYMTKPFDTLRLRKEVERMLGKGGLWQVPLRQTGSLAPAAPPPTVQAAFTPPAAVVPAPSAAVVPSVPPPAAVVPSVTPPAAVVPSTPPPAALVPADSAAPVAATPPAEKAAPANTPATVPAANGSDTKDGLGDHD